MGAKIIKDIIHDTITENFLKIGNLYNYRPKNFTKVWQKPVCHDLSEKKYVYKLCNSWLIDVGGQLYVLTKSNVNSCVYKGLDKTLGELYVCLLSFMSILSACNNF